MIYHDQNANDDAMKRDSEKRARDLRHLDSALGDYAESFNLSTQLFNYGVQLSKISTEVPHYDSETGYDNSIESEYDDKDSI